MRKILKLLLIFLGILVITYGIYLILGRPPIPLPVQRIKVVEDNQLYDFIKATESDEVTIELLTNGEINALISDASLVKISYTPKTLDNVLVLASKYVIPQNIQKTISTISRYCPCVRIIPTLVENFYYHVVRYQFTFVFAAN